MRWVGGVDKLFLRKIEETEEMRGIRTRSFLHGIGRPGRLP